MKLKQNSFETDSLTYLQWSENERTVVFWNADFNRWR